MSFDFTSILDRRGRDALAVDVIPFRGVTVREGFDTIPMWVADMNFPACPAIPRAIIERTRHPAYGYFATSKAYYDAIFRWQEKRNGVAGLTKECVGYENGVLGGVVNALNVFCSRGDKVLVHSPTYVGFTGSLTNNGYKIVHSALKRDGDGVWRMDLADMEEKLRTQHIHAAIFCSPHNPTGRVWERAELEEAMALFEKYDVKVVSDEIWSDLTLPGYRHIPTQSVSEDAKRRTVALYAPSKTFNLAGLVGSYRVVWDKTLQDRLAKEASLSHYNNMNVLSMHALTGAYSEEGEAWVDELRQVLAGNVDFACGYIAEHFPGVELARPQGTYMLFLDCAKWCADHGKDIDWLQRAGAEVGVMWQDGRPFHGPCHIRMNLALPRSRVEEAFRRLDGHVFNG